MPGRHGGRLKRGGKNVGQRGTLAMLQGQATLDLRSALTLAREMLHDDDRPDAVRLAAAEFIRRCTGIDRAPPPARKQPARFGVVRAPAAELAAQALAPPTPTPKRNQGPPSEKLVGARVAPLPGGTDVPTL